MSKREEVTTMKIFTWIHETLVELAEMELKAKGEL